MNIFLLDYDVEKCALFHCDKHCVKMVLEYAQILSTVCREKGGEKGYRSTHKNHPSTIWASTSLSNWKWLRSLALLINEEYKRRYDKSCDHKSADVILQLEEPPLPDLGITSMPLVMPDIYKGDDPVESYRRYFIGDKNHIAVWTKTTKPNWYN